MKDDRKSTAELEAELAALEVQILESEVKARAEADHLFFCRHILGYRHLDDDLHGGVSRLVCDMAAQRKFLLLLPRGHLKSSLVTVGLTCWLVVNNPNRTILIFSETSDLAQGFLREIKGHLEGPLIGRYWPNLVPDAPEVWSKEKILVNRQRISPQVTVEAMGIHEATAGRHPDIIIIDDPISQLTVSNEEQIRKSIARFRELQPLLEPPNDRDPWVGTEILIGTRWHWQDLYDHVAEKLSRYWRLLVRAAEEDGRIIFPQKFSRELLAELQETLGPWLYSSQYLNNPVDEDSAVFPASLIRQQLWKGSKEHFVERVPCFVYMTVDPSWEGEDATGIILAARTDKKLYTLEGIRARMSPDKMLQQVVSLAIRWRVRKIGFEGGAGGQEWLAKNLQTMLDEQKAAIPVQVMSHGNRQKHARILGLVPELKYRRLFIHEDNTQLQAELTQYPRSNYVDLIDSLAMMVAVATPPGRHRNVPPHLLPGTGEYEVRKLEEMGRQRWA